MKPTNCHRYAALLWSRPVHDACLPFHGRNRGRFSAALRTGSLAKAVNDLRITSLFLVPTLLRRLLELPKATLPLMPGLRLLISSGSSLYPQERRQIMRELCPNFFNFYSSSEGGGISLLRPEHPDEASLSVGQVVFGCGSPDHRRKPQAGRSRYGRDDPLSRWRGCQQLLPEPGGKRDRLPRRLVLSGRPRALRRGRVSLSDRPQQGHDHPQRRQHLPRRDRADAGRSFRRSSKRPLSAGRRRSAVKILPLSSSAAHR